MKRPFLFIVGSVFIVGLVDGALQDDSELVVFISGRSGNGDVYALDLESKEMTAVIATPFPEGGVRYDIANNRLVHQRYDDGRTTLMSGPRELFPDPAADVAPAWSPDGWRIVYSDTRDQKENLYLARPDGTGETPLTNDSLPDRYPSWSPDGSKIVFARAAASGWDLHTIDLGSLEDGPKRLTDAGVYVGHPSWSPNGQSIAFDMMFDDQTEIVTLDLDTGELNRLTDRPGNDLVPAWSLDGSHVVFAGQPDSTRNWDVWMVDIESLELQRLTTDPGFDGGPLFVPRSALKEDAMPGDD